MCIKSSSYPWEKMHTICLSVSCSCLWHSIFRFWEPCRMSPTVAVHCIPTTAEKWFCPRYLQQLLVSFTFLDIPMMVRWTHNVVVTGMSPKARSCSTFKYVLAFTLCLLCGICSPCVLIPRLDLIYCFLVLFWFILLL